MIYEKSRKIRQHVGDYWSSLALAGKIPSLNPVPTKSYVPFTEAEANRLALSLLEQLEFRFRHMLIEVSLAFGKPARRGYEIPPLWVLRSIRIVYTGKPAIMWPQKISAEDFFMALGSTLGMSKTWEAVLTDPLTEERELEKKCQVLGEVRARIKTLTTRAFKTTKKVGKTMEALNLKPSWRRAFIRGLELGADSIVSIDGKLNDDSTIRSDACFFMWVYWPQIKLLGSVRELANFFESMRQDGLSQKNLEKICREIGYSAKSRGRPKNLFISKTK